MSQSEKNLPLGVINEDARLKGAKHHRRMQTTITDYHPKPPLTFIPEPSSWVPYQDEKFLFCVDPLPANFTWYDLCEVARIEDTRYGWAYAAFESGTPSGRSWIIVQDRGRAKRVFGYFQERRLRTHVWNATKEAMDALANRTVPPMKPRPVFLNCNCSGAPVSIAQHVVHATDAVKLLPPTQIRWQPAPELTAVPQPAPALTDPSPSSTPFVNTVAFHVPQTANYTRVAPSSMPTPEESVQALSINLKHTSLVPAPSPAREAPIATQIRNGQLYTGNVNMTQGCVRTESRGVFVHGIDFNITQAALRSVFSKAGSIEKCELQNYQHLPSKKRHSGKAIIIYTTSDEAQQAKALFNGMKLGRKNLEVRLDREAVQAGPTVANGSHGATV